MHEIRFRLGLCSRPHWGSLQRSRRPSGWILEGLYTSNGTEGRARDEKGEGRGRDRREGKKGGKNHTGTFFLQFQPCLKSARNINEQ